MVRLDQAQIWIGCKSVAIASLLRKTATMATMNDSVIELHYNPNRAKSQHLDEKTMFSGGGTASSKRGSASTQ